MINHLLNKTVVILGLGKSGLSTARELKKRGVHVIAWDDNIDAQNKAKELQIKIQNLNSIDFSVVEFLVISPGIPHTYPQPHPMVKLAKQNNVKIISDIELFINTYNKAHYIGITGTNGKSTTTALIYHILKENNIPCAIGGNFGIPIFDLPELNEKGYYVLEMSSYQLEITPSINFDISVLLNITPDHLSRHNGLEGYINAKKLIFNHISKNKFTNIIAIDDLHTKKIFTELSKINHNTKTTVNIPISISKKINGYYTSSKGQLIDNLTNQQMEILNLNTLNNLNGKHNWQNILAAFATTKSINLTTTSIINAIKSFKGLEHRIEKIGVLNGIEFINDSKATNAESAKYAIDSINDIYWIIGGRSKEGGISILLPNLKKGNIKKIFTIGECEKDFYNITKNIIPSYKCHRLENAVLKAFKLALKDIKKGEVKNPTILLSPATASFDQYKSFEERGNHFKQIYKELYSKYYNK